MRTGFFSSRAGHGLHKQFMPVETPYAMPWLLNYFTWVAVLYLASTVAVILRGQAGCLIERTRGEFKQTNAWVRAGNAEFRGDNSGETNAQKRGYN